jgi:hypothetical protein
MTEESKVVIEEPVKTNEEPEIVVEGLSEKEVEMGRSSGVIPKEVEEKKDEHKEQPVVEAKEDAKASFEEVEKDERLLERYSKPEKGLYMKWKIDKHKRQEAQKEKDELQAKLDLGQVKTMAYSNKLNKLKEMLKKGDELTADQLLNIIDEGKEEKSEEAEPRAPADVLKEKIATKAQFAEKIGETKYDNFKEIANLAKEVITNDTTGTYQELIDKSFTDDKVDENMLVERVVNIARLSPKFSELTKTVEPEKKEEANRVLKNAQKKVSSAALPSSGGKRVVSEDELTVADAARLNTEQWGKLSDKTRKRILMGQDP